MLVFVTSLRHPQNSDDYGRVEVLLRASLASVTNQTSDDYVVIVVGNQRPDFDLPEKVHFVPVDFPPPVDTVGPRTPLPEFVWDKGTKIGVGLIAARAFNPDYVMIFDADDFVHRNICDFVESSKEKSPFGWYIDKGYKYSSRHGIYQPISDLNRVCGTCHIVHWDIYNLPEPIDLTASQAQVSAAFGDRLSTILGAHRNGIEWFGREGIQLSPLPFRGAVYHVDTGENHSGSSMRGISRPVGNRLQLDYAVPSHEVGVGQLFRAVGPKAIWQSVPKIHDSTRLAALRSSAVATLRNHRKNPKTVV